MAVRFDARETLLVVAKVLDNLRLGSGSVIIIIAVGVLIFFIHLRGYCCFGASWEIMVIVGVHGKEWWYCQRRKLITDY